jgi:squalene-associated FAD-dependent desaturase
MQPSAQSPTIAVIGGGLAGLAAACALAGSGFRVTVFERRPYLGGRASSYEHPATGEIVDNCQHVLLGCCTNLLDFYRRTGVEDKIRWCEQLTFVEPGGRSSVIMPSRLPAPLHALPSFFRASCLDLRDKWAIAAAISTLAPRIPPDREQSFLSWLRRHGQSARAMERFWKPVLVSALNEEIERISVPYAAQVFRESFLKSRSAGRIGLPTVPLSELYGKAGEYISARGGEIRLRSSLESYRAEFSAVKLCVSGREEHFDFVVMAVPFDALARVLPQTSAAEPLRQALTHFETSPITGIHLWFDREITELEHAVLLERTIQWMFHKSRFVVAERHDFGPAAPQRKGDGTSPARNAVGKSDALAAQNQGSYIELVVSSSRSLVEKSRHEIIDLALSELYEFFPDARDANLVKSTVIKELHATYSPRPGIDAYRPRPETVWPRIFLAGDWTATGWPATMEGAVRSGYLAAQCVARVGGLCDAAYLVPNLPATGFMRLFG